MSNSQGNEWYYTGLFAAAGYSSGDVRINDLELVGGEVSTGTHDLMKSNDNYNSYGYQSNSYSAPNFYVYISALCGYTNNYGVILNNVHSSVTMKIGSGQQFRTCMGSLLGGGYSYGAQYCSNSGDLIGGYKEFNSHERVNNETYMFGGLFGYSYTTNYMFNCANYGNIYSVALIGDGSKLPPYDYYKSRYANSAYADISAWYIPSSSGNLLNEGMIFDGPVELDANGDPVFLESTDDTVAAKPKAPPLPEGKIILDNYTTLNNNQYDYQLNIMMGIL